MADAIYGPSSFNVDAFVGCRRKARLFERNPNLTVQLNVRNVTDEQEYSPLQYNNTYSGYARVILYEPRNFRCSIGVDF